MGEDLEPRDIIQPAPVGGVKLGEDRLRLVLPQWEVMHDTIRLMDSLEMGETEPATVYIWWGCQP